MAASGVYELTRFTAIAAGDVLPAVDISDTTQSAHGSLLSITVTNFFASIPVPVVVTSASAAALAVGLAGATNPAFTVDASTALQAAGLTVVGAVTGGTVAVVVRDSGSNANLTINAKGTGTIGIGSASTGRVTITPATTITGVLTATGGVTGNLTGNASTATALATPRAINGVNFDGSAGITVPAAAGTLTGATLASGVTASSLTSTGVLAALHMTSPVIDSGGLTITSGTLAAQAVTVSGSLTVSKSAPGDVVATFTNTNTSTPSGMVVAIGGTPNNNSQFFWSSADGAGSGTSRAIIFSNGGISNFSANNVNLSDARTKKPGWTPLAYDFDQFQRISIVRYQYKDQTHTDDNFGVIADELEIVDPHFVDEFAFGPKKAMRKMVYEHDLFYAHMDITQQLQRRVKTLEAQLAARN